VRRAPLPLLLFGLVTSLAAQTSGPRPPPAIAVLDLRFDGERANVLEPSDTAVARAATSALLATLQATSGIAVTDSARVAAAVAAEEASGNACDRPCALRVGSALGARWVAKGRLIKTSNLVWVFTAELFEVATGRPLLADGYELKGDPKRMAPAGAHAFAQRIERTIAAQERP
jgi:TolB-like protein